MPTTLSAFAIFSIFFICFIISFSVFNINSEENTIEEETKNIEENDETNAETSQEDDYKAKYEALNNQYVRLAADFDNYRKRTEAQKTELINMGLENALKKMIEVLDNFDRAKKTMEGITDCEAALKSFDVLYNQVFENLKKLGLEIIKTENEISGFSIILTSFQGDRTVLTHRGTNATIKECEIDFDAMKNLTLISTKLLCKHQTMMLKTKQ